MFSPGSYLPFLIGRLSMSVQIEHRQAVFHHHLTLLSHFYLKVSYPLRFGGYS